MNWLPFLHSEEPRADPQSISQAQVDAAIDRLVRMTNPRLALLDRYRERLAPAVEVACRYARAIAASLPSGLDARPDRWVSCNSLRAFFVSGDDITQVYGSSADLRRLFRNDLAIDNAHAMLAMRFTEQQVFGMALEGDTVRRDVAQTTVSFSRHRIRVCAGSESKLRDAVAGQVIDHLALRTLARLTRLKDRRHELEIDRALLKARLRMHERRGAGLDGKEVKNGDLARLEAALDSNAEELSAVGGGAAGLERAIDVLREVLGAPSEFVRCTMRRVKLSPVNVVLHDPGAEPHLEIEFMEVYIDADPPTTVAMMPTRFPRDALPLQMSSMAERGGKLL